MLNKESYSALSILWCKRDRRTVRVFQNLSFTHQGMSLQAIFNCYCKGLRVSLDVLSHFYVSFVAIQFLSCHCFMAISLVGISILAGNKKETKSSDRLSSKRFCSRIALFFCGLCTDVSLPSGKPDREKGLFSRFFPEGGETSLHRLIFQAQMGKTSISYEFHGVQFFIVKLLTSIDSQPTTFT